jgi:hypothetical protein
MGEGEVVNGVKAVMGHMQLTAAPGRVVETHPAGISLILFTVFKKTNNISNYCNRHNKPWN